MASIKLKFRPSTLPLAAGTLYYQIIYKRCTRWICTNYHIFPDEWDKATASLRIPSSGKRKTQLQLMQSLINWECKQCRNFLYEKEASNEHMSIDELCKALRNACVVKTVFMFLQEQVNKKERMQRYGTAKTYANAYHRFRDFRNNADLTFDELTSDLIEAYEAWLTHRELKRNTIRFYLRTLHTLINKAHDEGLISSPLLFSKVKLAYVKTRKRAISENELKALIRLPLPLGSPLAFARDIFLFSFYMRGMPFVDIAYLKKKNLRNGQLAYCRKKTNQHLTVEWEKAQQNIIDRYAHLTQNSPYMLPILLKEDGTEYRQYQRMQENINRNLKKIGQMIGLKMPLTTYVARHTWASIARNMNFSIAIISEGMGHTSYKTTQVYLDSIDTAKINQVNKKIIQRFQFKL